MVNGRRFSRKRCAAESSTPDLVQSRIGYSGATAGPASCCIRGMAFKHILVATDFSECSAHAVDLAVELAQKFEASLTLVHAWEAPYCRYDLALYVPPDFSLAIEDAANKQLNRAVETVKLRALGDPSKDLL